MFNDQMINYNYKILLINYFIIFFIINKNKVRLCYIYLNYYLFKK